VPGLQVRKVFFLGANNEERGAGVPRSAAWLTAVSAASGRARLLALTLCGLEEGELAGVPQSACGSEGEASTA